MIRIAGARVVDPSAGRWEERPILIRDGRVVAESGETTGDGAAETIDLTGRYVMPGFIDLHTHVSYRDSNSPYEFDLARGLPEVAVDGMRNARLILEAGFTTVRDCGSPPGVATAIKRAIDAGEFVGPRMQVAGQILSGVGGLGDIHPNHLFEDNTYQTAMSRLVKDPWDARNAVRRQVKDGVEWLKVTLSGTAANPRVPAERDDLDGDLFDAIVREAELLGVQIIAHAESSYGAYRAARAGTRTIEHGVHLSDETIGLMVRNGVALVPTLAQYTTWATRGAELGRSRTSMEAHRRVHGAHLDSVRRAYKAGVRIGVGGDAGGVHFPQGSAAQEVAVLHEEIGLTVADAIRAMTVYAAEVLGMAEEIGRLEPGYRADLVVLDGDPFADPRVLADAARIRAVVKDGALVSGSFR